MITLRDFLTTATADLSNAGVDDPAREARTIMAHVLGCDRATLITMMGDALIPEKHAQACAVLARRKQREPWARIVGSRDFYGLPFALTADTLEPRPDSETLVDAVLEVIPNTPTSSGQPWRILDWGTGTGCLLLAILHARDLSLGWGIDCALGAVQQAHRNADSLGLSRRTTFDVGDWTRDALLATTLREAMPFDVVVSNPPYITTADYTTLMPEVRDHDPPRALLGGNDGLDAYRLLIPLTHQSLKSGGLCAFEVGYGQHTDVARLLRDSGFHTCTFHKDLSGVTRVILARKL